ncbi:hypothetical protein [Chryseobacterium sp.]|jgi:hypothetical protein|uniref:hypothetical protein n=1 Tax=Chryseobacterium sp. TaxID=1871047 RepID=UPI0028412407|nr:hypothetical protein [Chryseobacterium sp.]MDR3025158.1 hypothetical protein [Chryseobacterium sp.]
MKNYFYLVFAFITLVNCKGQKEEKLLSIEDKNFILNKTFLGVTKKNNKYEIIDRCDGGYPSLKISEKILFYYYPQEGAYHTIKNISKIKDGEYKIVTDGYYYFKNDQPIPENKIWVISRKDDLIWEFLDSDSNKKNIFSDSLNIINKKIAYVKLSCDNNDETEKDITTKTNNYSADGTWKTSCDQGAGSITIEGKNASLVLLYDQIYIDLVEVKRYGFEKGIAYKLKELPEDLGSIGTDLNWKEYLNDEPIAYVKKIDDNTVNFYWYGFYNKKTKKREFKDNSFYQETGMKDIILKKCNE